MKTPLSHTVQQSFARSAAFTTAFVLLLATLAKAATISWSAASGTDTNWSTGANWTNITAGSSGTAPGSGDDVKFFDPGSVSGISNINNVVDGSFLNAIGSLQYGNTNNFHTTQIASGQTLNITGPNGLIVGTPADIGIAKNLTNVITGAGGTLNINNPTANLVLNQGSATSVTLTRANLDLSGLDSFIMNGRRIGIGTTVLPNPGNANQREAGSLFLAKTNIITLAYTDTLANYQLAGRTNALEMSRNPGNNAGILSLLYLGNTNFFALDSLGIGRDKASASSAAWMGFNPAFSANNPAAVFRGADGVSRVTWWAIGDMNANASSAQVSIGTNDFTGGSVDALVNVISLGRDCTPNHTATPNIIGVLTFSAGVIDVNTLYVGNQALGPSGTASVTPLRGFVNVNGTATLIVNNNLVLGNTTVFSLPATNTSGTLNIRNGTVCANSISTGAVSTNNIITMTNGLLVVTNTAGTPAKGITTLNITNSMLQLRVTGLTNIVVTNLVSGGATNIINPAFVGVFPSYPTQVTLIQYSGVIGGVGYNFGFGANLLPPTAPNAYLSNNVANKSIDLVLPCDPRPVIATQPASYSGSPGDNVIFSAGVGGCSVLPLSYQWFLGANPLADGPSGNGSTLSGSLTASLSINNAQPADNGNYTLIVTNIYGSTTSTPANLTISSGCVAPSISGGPNNITIVQGNNASFTASVAGSPLPAIQWRRNGVDIPSETSASYTLNNVQYPADDQAVFSMVATNSCGATTNSATLTVIVPPSLTCQPTNLTVISGSPASFNVCATGVPAPGYQWKKNGVDIPGATTSTLTFANTVPTDAAVYSVTVNNSAGSTNSAGATLLVNSTMSVTSFSPANGATGICPDTILKITFDSAPVIGNAGRIRIFNVTNTTTPVDTLDLGANGGNGAQPRLIAATSYNTYPVIVSGNTATIFPHLGVLTTNQSYYVLVETVLGGAFKDGSGATFAGISDSGTWQFSTKAAGPVSPNSLTVAADGSGDFTTVQGAMDFIPANNTTPTIVNIKNGLYREVVFINGKNNIAFHGQDKNNTVISYPNNDPLNGGTSLRPMFRARGNDITFDNLTLTNSTPKGGGQAEALRIDGQRLIFTNVFLASYQDTLLINNAGDSAYFWNCLIQGDTDFIWGLGTPYFQNCEIRALNAGHNTQMRTDASHYGATFVDSLISKTNGATFTTHTLGRGILSESDNGNANYLNCRMDTHITPAGWQVGGANPATVRYWEYQSVALDGVTPIDVSSRAAYSQQISASTALTLRNLTNALAGWLPPLALSLNSQPTNQTVNGRLPVSFTVTASGIFAPLYQWRHEGTNVPGATSRTLTVPHAHAEDAGLYNCIISNINGVLVSSNATLAVNAATQPTISSVSFSAGQLLLSISGDTGPDYAIQASTNLMDWQTIFTTNSPATPFTYTDPTTSLYMARFYRIVAGPPLP